MNKLVPIGLGAAAVVVALVVGAQLSRSPAPERRRRADGRAVYRRPRRRRHRRRRLACHIPPPLTETFTSPLHGISVSYPEGWTARAATEPWTDGPSPIPSMTTGRPPVRPDPDRPSVPGHRLAADRRLHARGLGRGADGGNGRMRACRRADRRGRGNRTDRGRRLRPRGRHNRWPRLLDLAPHVQRRSSRRRCVRPGVVRGGPCHRATASRGRHRCGAVGVALIDRPSTIANASSLNTAHDPDRSAGGPRAARFFVCAQIEPLGCPGTL